MADLPANHVDRVKRIQRLCTELSESIETAQEQRRAALKLAREALALVDAVGEDELEAEMRQKAAKT